MNNITKSAIRAVLFSGVVYTAILWFIENESGEEMAIGWDFTQGAFFALIMGIMQYRTLKK